MGAGADIKCLSAKENADFTSMTFGLLAQRSLLPRLAATTVALELGSPGEEFLLIESQVLSELDVRHFIQSGALVDPTHLDAQEPRSFVNG